MPGDHVNGNGAGNGHTGGHDTDLVVRHSHARPHADAWALVLEAMAVPYRVVPDQGGWSVLVPTAHAARAVATLDAHDRELAEGDAGDEPAPDVGGSWPALLAAVALLAFFFVTGERGSLAGREWFTVGSSDADKVLAGQWWRVITALTLHADGAHVLGNAVALSIFAGALCRWVGAGVALLALVATGAVGNWLTAMAYGGAHNSVGASTTVFGALGVLGGLQFLRRFRARGRYGRRRRALTVVAACLGVFAMLGVGERSDVMAHLMGLACGLPLGWGLGLAIRAPVRLWIQGLLAVASITVVWVAWWVALAR